MRNIYYSILGVMLLTTANAQDLGLKSSTQQQVSMEVHQSVVKQNAQLQRELEYHKYQRELMGGANLLLTQANYHMERGETVTAQEKMKLIQVNYEGTPEAKAALNMKVEDSSADDKPIALPAVNENFLVETDTKNGVTWYYDKRIPRGPETTSMYLYMGHKATGSAWLRFHAQYVGTHWIHLQGDPIKV